MMLRRCVTPLCRQRLVFNSFPLTRAVPYNTLHKRFASTENEKQKENEQGKKEDVHNVANQATSQNFTGSLITWKSVAVMLVLGGIGLYVLDKVKKQRYKEIHKVASIGAGDIGGSFFLVDQYGKPTADTDFRGKFMFIYFGFTHCPDVCPIELKKMAEVLDKLEKRGLADYVAPLYITIDPWRDTVEMMRIYSKEVHPRLLGLTGTPAQITKLAKSYRVYMNQAGEGEEYLIDHSVILYLMGPDGKFVKFYGKVSTADEVADSISEFINPPSLTWWGTFKRAFGLEE